MDQEQKNKQIDFLNKQIEMLNYQIDNDVNPELTDAYKERRDKIQAKLGLLTK